ncbi:MAG: MFS transporter [Caulobacteraceae bacterium]|nr:MFS transporter [Caulobacteraceae bacterium]
MTQSSPSRAPAFGFILASVFLDALSFGLIFPILPRLILGLSGHDTAYAARMFGLMAAAWSLMNFVASPVLGALSDRFGRRPVLLISTFGLSLDFLIMALAPTVAWLFVGRAMSGLTAASYSAASAYLADTTPPDERAKRFGLFSAVSGVGFIIGPAAGGLLAALSPRAPFFAAAGLAALGWLYGLLILPESLPPELRTRTPWRSANPVRAFGILAKDRGMLALAAIWGLIVLASQAVNIVFVLYTAHRYNWSAAQTGLLLTVFSAGNILVMGVMAPRLARRFGERSIMMCGVALSAIGFVGLGLSPMSLVFCLACVPTCLGNMCGPPVRALQTKRVGPTEQGRLQGALSALQALTGLVGPIFFTQVFAWSNSPGSAKAMSGLSFLVAAVLMAAALPCALAVSQAPKAVEGAAA